MQKYFKLICSYLYHMRFIKKECLWCDELFFTNSVLECKFLKCFSAISKIFFLLAVINHILPVSQITLLVGSLQNT